MFEFQLLHTDARSAARRGRFQTPHGALQTPAFMPVGTLATVKGLTMDQVQATGAEMVLANTYHLALRPGEDVVATLGGLHTFMGWDGPILTDSGGFQIFSLAERTQVTEQSAVFRAPTDGRLLEISPERAVRIQERLGGDVAMVLDHVVGLPCEKALLQEATERTVRWARRCQDAHRHPDQALFAIVQGGLNRDLRRWCTEQLVELEFPGYAVGGLSVGEPPEEMYEMLDATCPLLPAGRPRYLMGVGRPIDLLEGIHRGIDMFDCVMPTRNGRNGHAFTDEGPVKLRNHVHRQDPRPLDPTCPCVACGRSRGYLRHLFMTGEMLGPILVSLHNLTYYQRLVAAARQAIEQDRWALFIEEKRAGWQQGAKDTALRPRD